MPQWAADIIIKLGLALIEKLAAPFFKWIADLQEKSRREEETKRVLEEVKNAQTEQERINAARSSAHNSTGK